MLGRAVYICASTSSVRWLLKRLCRLPHGKDRKPAFTARLVFGDLQAGRAGPGAALLWECGGRETQRVLT